MIHSSSKRDMALVLLLAVGAHVVFFFGAATAVANDLIKGKIEKKERKKKKEKEVGFRMVSAEEFFALPEVEPETVVPLPGPVVPEPEMEKPEEVVPPAFVQTKESQESEKVPEDTPLIGERDTTASSDEKAIEGESKLTALDGEEEMKNDPKTFDSTFSKGDQDGPSQGVDETVDTGRGADQVNQDRVESTASDSTEAAEMRPAVEENRPPPTPEKIPSIDRALAALEEEIEKEEMKKEESAPVAPKPESVKPQPQPRERSEASNQDGGFAPRTRKTRVAGVISARGDGSLNVAKTAVGQYQAKIFKLLETAWQMENIRNRSLLAPGNITIYFAVDEGGKVSHQRQVARVGASGTQFGMILRALESINIPKMPKEVVKELDGDRLEIIVTFKYS